MNTKSEQEGGVAGSDSLKTLALVPLLLARLVDTPEFAADCVVVFLVTGFLYRIFTGRFKPGNHIHWLFPAVLLCVLLPASAGYGQIVLVTTFGIVAGEQIYGGRGYSFTSPVLVALALLFYSFEFSASGESAFFAEPWIPLAIVLIPVPLLLYVRQLELWSLVSIVAGFCATAVVTGSDVVMIPAVASIACILYCSCDPLLCPGNPAGKVMYGWLVGSLVFVLDPSEAMIEKTVFACLLGTVTAPLLDWFGEKTAAFLSAAGTTEKRSSEHV